MTFVRATNDRELKTVYISGNGMEDELCVVFNKTSFNIYKKDANNEFTVLVSANDYNLKIENLSTPHVKISFVSQGNIEMKFEYVLYKTIKF